GRVDLGNLLGGSGHLIAAAVLVLGRGGLLGGGHLVAALVLGRGGLLGGGHLVAALVLGRAGVLGGGLLVAAAALALGRAGLLAPGWSRLLQEPRRAGGRALVVDRDRHRLREVASPGPKRLAQRHLLELDPQPTVGRREVDRGRRLRARLGH